MGDFVTDSQSILARWKNQFFQLLRVCEVNGVRQTEIHIAEKLVPETSACEVVMAIEKLKRHQSPRIDQIPAEFIKSGGRKIRFEIH